MLDCFPARVVEVRRITPHMIRIHLQVMDDRLWCTDGHGDERIDLALPREGRTVADFAVHEGGFASGWAERAEPGHVVGLFGGGRHASQYHEPPADAEHQLLVVDATGLPGLARILDELTPGARATAIVEIPTPEDRQDLTTVGDVTVEWLVGTGNGLGPSALPEAVAAQPVPDAPWYAWVACEAAASRRIRTHLRREMGLARDRHHAIGYWNESLTGNRSAEVE